LCAGSILAGAYIGDLEGFAINEYGDDGELQPFKTIYGLSVSERKDISPPPM
jgi:hypothetical protein